MRPMEIFLQDFMSLQNNSTFASCSTRDEFGSFYPFFVTIRLDFPRSSSLKPWEINRFLKENSDEGVRARKAIESFAYFHELRHFHDYFGTLGGINLFYNFLQMLREFYSLSEIIRSIRRTWQLPLTEYAQRPDCPELIRLFVHKYKVMSFARDALLGRLLLGIDSGSTNENWRQVSAPEIGMDFPAFPYSAWIIDHDTNKRQEVTVWQPIGFEALVEGAAQSLQRSYLEVFWPDSVVETAWKLLMESSVQFAANEMEHGILSSVLPYNLTDLLVSKFARNCGHQSWERKRLLSLTDTALMQSYLHLESTGISNPVPGRKATNVKVTSRHPGTVFVEHLKRANWTANEHVEATDSTSEIFTSLRESFANYEPPEDAVTNREASAIDIIEAFVRHKIIVPLLDARARYGADVFCSPTKYIEHQNELPRPIIISHSDSFESANDIDDRMLKKWVEFCFLANTMEQLMDGKEVIACPRAYSLVPGFEFFELAEGGCTKHIQGRTCQAWSSGMLASLPNCTFSNLIRHIALEC